MSDLLQIFTRHSDAIGTHLVVSTAIVLLALAAATWIRPLTARTRSAMLVTAMTALLVPPVFFEKLLELIAGRPVQTIAGPLPRFTLGLAALQPAPAAAFPWLGAAIAGSLAISALLLTRWWITTQRLVWTATRVAIPPPARAVAALTAARRRLELHRSIDLIVSPLCEAPAAVRVIRPLIVLPSDACSALDDDELESLLCHECAHVARHDNLIGVIEAFVTCLFWFNPAIWLLHRRIGLTREAACDELVADTASHAETYAGAVAKFCDALIAPRVAGVSCMATAHLKERMQSLMNYPSLRTRALSHGTTSFLTAAFVLLAVASAGVLTADPVVVEKDKGPYRLNYSIQRTSQTEMIFNLQIVETDTGKLVTAPNVRTELGQSATTKTGTDEIEYVVAIETRSDASGTIKLTVLRGSETLQTSTANFLPQPVQPEKPQYTGRPITMKLNDADIKDVIKTFAELTGTNIAVDPEVKGTVTVDFVKVPWDQALETILRQNGLTYQIEEGGLRVRPVTQ